MRNLSFILFGLFFLAFAPKTEAQLLKKLVRHAKEKVRSEAENRSKKRIDKGIDKTFDKAEDAIDGKNKKSGNASKNTDGNNQKPSANTQTGASPSGRAAHQPQVLWNKYDFVPGDVVIFEDGPAPDEENGEFPSKWDLYKGNAEIGEVDGEKVIMFLSSSTYIIPYIKNASKDYLPDVFTVEFDVYMPKGTSTNNRLWVYLGDQKNQNRMGAASTSLVVMPHSLEFGESEKAYPGTENIGWSVEREGSWKHISIAYTRGKFKAYFNDTRLINVPHLGVNPTGITIYTSNKKIFIKNFRIAKGGVKYYQRVLSDGKIIVNGIKFDVNKASLKPESMGPINRIYQLMKRQPDLKFSVEGHTDSDGSEAANLKLSKARAKTVMDKLIAMGIEASRLKYTGWGESKPIDTNATAEGKANNRRVEFVRF